ncbi:DUF1176 domain-containing protein [Acinetobacter sp. SwsAc6]|uniref:DUF1176 domain-containing protein n=1 Tax=Acinetobacter cumulans TaxID=2136182 RepID=A0A498CUS0_9GAMM|nr:MULTISPECIES: DUF1176 domain-containing protein [Acinetobacter]NWK74381.1 DUF1176 domain-containing protein [Acinetobacter sp. SwsAc6]RLL29425.1 DUF1176 domain-containing protein [Acinetobacter cumulans]
MEKNKFIIQCGIGLSLVMCSALGHAQIEGQYFAHKDWEVACDNTGTCRVAGYQAEQQSSIISVLLQRVAGAQSKLSARVKIDATALDGVQSALQFYKDGKPQSWININPKTGEGVLDASQTEQLLTALQGTKPVLWGSGKQRWQLSVDGASAVLLRMDDFQRRIGTNSATLRKGKTASDKVLKAQEMPKVNIQHYQKGMQSRYSVHSKTAKQLYVQLKKQVKASDCPLIFEQNFMEGDRVIAYPINEQNLLLEIPCWRAAYNYGNGYWLMDRQLKQVKQLVTVSANSFSEGQIFANQRGRGIADCNSTTEWAWNGSRFVLSYRARTVQCKGFIGGAWALPTWVTTVQQGL